MDQRTPLVIRSFLGLITYTSLLVGVMLLPIFIANIVLNTAPFWTSLLAWCFLGEPVMNMEIICMVGCFVGVVIIATSELIHPAAHTIGKNTTGGKLEHHAFKMSDNLHKLGLDKYMTSSQGYVTGMIVMMVAAWS